MSQTNDDILSDYPLTAADIGRLENQQQIVDFFAALGYDVDNSVQVDQATLGLDSADLQQRIREIRLVGSDPVDGDLSIYLFHTRSVTLDLRRRIANAFRERTGDYLLVLTSDYETLDFVLLESDLKARKGPGKTLKQAIRPRSLTVNRRSPEPVHLPDHLDFSASVVSYAKAVEQAIMQRLFEPFRAARFSSSDVNNSVFKKYMDGERKLTLGNFPFILTSKEKALAEFAVRQYPGRGRQMFFEKTNSVRALLDDQTSIDLRNAAAHSEALSKEDARKAREWALGILRFL